MRVENPWEMSLREVAAIPSLETSKACLDVAPSSLVRWEMSLQRGWNGGASKILHIPNYSMILSTRQALLDFSWNYFLPALQAQLCCWRTWLWGQWDLRVTSSSGRRSLAGRERRLGESLGIGKPGMG